jgi:hypothetical protein
MGIPIGGQPGHVYGGTGPPGLGWGVGDGAGVGLPGGTGSGLAGGLGGAKACGGISGGVESPNESTKDKGLFKT